MTPGRVFQRGRRLPEIGRVHFDEGGLEHFGPSQVLLLKLALGLATFLAIAWLGGRFSKRVTGLLLTFPLLNGIALITSSDPARAASAIYVVVMVNCLLIWAVITWVEWLPPLGTRSPLALGLLRLAAWIAAWGLGAYPLILYRDALPGGPVLFAIQLAIVGASLLLWRAPQAVAPASAPSWPRWVLEWSLRIALFIAVFAILQYTALAVGDQKWVGLASALPLPGLFALAYLSTQTTSEGLRPIRDTVLIGPLLVIPFNALYAWAIVQVPVWKLSVLLLAWAFYLLVIVLAVPPLERSMDRRRGRPD